ncbi:MAG: NADH-quinone oxidoreductase subunit NuoG [Fimbriimonadaceae bacterium]|nr:NADH-quinone oxidoreductase subunit NuoG [Fimbriimonadaceae bacterium]
MAAAPQSDMVKIAINDIEIEVPKGELIVESVKRLGLEIPIFCYHPRMKPVGMCRMCLVEVGFRQPDGSVRKMPKPQAGCTLPASDGMVIYTDSEMVHRDRKGVLEFLLINHPLDCPICDRGGECPLQNNTLAYGPSTSRFTELKRHLPKAYPLSRHVVLDLERCIQCGRCVRFTEEISGDAQLAFRFRGAEMQPSTFQLTDFESKFSGNVIEICPVGALTSRNYRFRARPWDLETRPGLCTITPCGTNVWFDHRAGRLIRINGRTNEAVNEEWTSDATKFGHDFYNSPDRLLAPNLRSGDGFQGTGWSEAYQAVLPAFQSGPSALLIGTQNVSNEALFLAQKLFRDGFKSSNIDHRLGLPIVARSESLAVKHGIDPIQTNIASLETMDAVLVFGTSLADEEPMAFLRVRKGWFQRGMKVVVAHSEATDADRFAQVILRYREGAEAVLASGLADLVAGRGDAAKTASETGVAEEMLKEAAAALSGRTAILTTCRLALPAAEALAGLAREKEFAFWQMAVGANQQGAAELGVLPDTLPGGAADPNPGLDAVAVLEAAARGEIKALWLAGLDPFELHPDRALVERALENVETLVVQHWMKVEACSYATAILPMSLPAEHDGTYTSVERRVQRMQPALKAPGESKPAWRIFAECLFRINPGVPAFNAGEVMDQIAAEVPAFAAAAYPNLAGEGVILEPAKTLSPA